MWSPTVLTLSAKPSFEQDPLKPLRFPYFWLAGGLVLVILVLNFSLMPGFGRDIGMTDKVAHFLVFLVLMVWFCGVFRGRVTPWVALGLLAFGILIEILQSRLPYRSAELYDAFADVGGILLGWGVAAVGLGQWTALVESWLPAKSS